MAETLRDIPSVDRLLAHPRLAAWNERLTAKARTRVIQSQTAAMREAIQKNVPFGEDELLKRIEARFHDLALGGIRPVINATGVILHTNLGRAPLRQAWLTAMTEALSGYCSLEMDMTSGDRGSRTAYLENLICLATGAEAALVVNNNAAALLLLLQSLARGKKVLISRGELVQIGGGFKIPEILEASGAELSEVGTTNITSLADYTAKIAGDTALILKVHHSNFAIIGHTESPSLKDLVKTGIPVAMDLGSGELNSELLGEPTVSDTLRAGVAALCFSGDKLLSSAQAGIVVGQKEIIQKLKKTPLYRALRLGKMELFMLEQALRENLFGKGTLVEDLALTPVSAIRVRAETLAKGISVTSELREGTSSIGGGALPDKGIPTILLTLHVSDPEKFCHSLLRAPAPVVLLRENGRLSLDLRTVFPRDDEKLKQSLIEAARCLS